jgi:hypothetical protein
MITQVYKKDTLSGPFFRYVSLCMNCEEEHEWAVTEWLADTPDTAKTYYHQTLMDALWDIEWWHRSNNEHGYRLIDIKR